MLLNNQQCNSDIEINLHLDMTWSNPNSVSRIYVLLEAGGKGENTIGTYAVICRPSLFSTIIKTMPISGRLHFMEHKIGYVETRGNLGAEKQKSTFKRGDLGFMVSNGSICIVLQDTKGINMNHIGHCLEDPHVIRINRIRRNHIYKAGF